ncbi:MAG: hypothetical protein KAJ90_07945, partial [Desulfobacterales bacterium]|nr:hypothetical protein [Desulfobacterales bacterium]
EVSVCHRIKCILPTFWECARICTTAIPSLDFDRMGTCEACGKIPVLCLMHIAQANGWSGALIDYKNSGDTGGPKNPETKVEVYEA